jgi:hypothetical protein
MRYAQGMGSFTQLASARRKQPEIDAAVAEVVRELTPSVHHIRWEIGEDWTGDGALFCRIVLSDYATQGKRLGKTTRKVTALLREKLEPLDLDLFVYPSFRSRSEQTQIRDKAWA